MKGNLFLGTGRGKLGDVVGRVLHGQQIFSKYQPIVFNRNSQRQRLIRSFFSNSSIQTKAVMDKASNNSLNVYYNNQYGASRNVRNLFTSLGMRARILQEDGLKRLGVPNVLPISTIGQNFQLFGWTYTNATEGSASFIPSAMVPLSKLYFGSDVLLTEMTSYIGFGTAYSQSGVALGSSSTEIPIKLTPNAVGSAIENKSFGFYENLADVTGWNYTYELEMDPSTGWESFFAFCNQIENGNQDSAYAFISWQDQNGRIIMQRSGSPKFM